MSGSFGWGGMLIGGLIFLGVIVLAVLLIAALVRHGRSNHKHGHQVPPVNPNEPGAQSVSAAAALAILNERYAKGEIEQEEYLSRKTDLLK
jgi:putative membrane protein